MGLKELLILFILIIPITSADIHPADQRIMGDMMSYLMFKPLDRGSRGIPTSQELYPFVKESYIQEISGEDWNLVVQYWGLKPEDVGVNLNKTFKSQQSFMKGIQNIIFVNASIPGLCLFSFNYCTDALSGFYYTGYTIKNTTAYPANYFGNFIIVRVSDNYPAKHANPTYVVVHEIGHNVWAQFTTDNEKREWWKYYNDDEKYHFLNNDPFEDNNNFITDYSMVNIGEDFAENWAQWYVYRKSNNPKRLRIIKDITNKVRYGKTG